ncbi:MAG: hypothetical protein ACKPCP_22870 [Sphaerospermopsis kisseleviana]
MARGGARSNAGAKSKWKHGKTKPVRIPESLIPKVLEYLQNLDKVGIIENVSQSKSVTNIFVAERRWKEDTLNLSNISIHRLNGKSFVFVEDLIKAGYEIEPSRLADVVLDEMYKSQTKGANTVYVGQKSGVRKDS